MRNTKFLLNLLVIFMILLSTISFSQTTNNSISNPKSNTLGISSVINTISSNSMLNNSNTINQPVITNTFKDIFGPISGYVNYIVLLIFVIVLAYGLLEIYGEMNIEPEQKLKAMFEYTIGASSILLVSFILYAYANYFPQIIEATAPNLLNIHGVIPVSLIWFDLLVAMAISIVGFIFAMKELLMFIRTFQPTLHEDAKEFERNSALTRFLVLIAFAFFSPLVVGVLFVIITQIFFSFSASVSQSLTNVAYNSIQYNIVSASVYQSNMPSCGANIFSGDFWNCLGENLMYSVFSRAYTVGFEGSIISTALNLMTNPFGSDYVFDIIYELIVLILYVYGFIKIDWYSLEYVSSLKTGEREAFNYEKLKRAYIQYIGFILSPIFFIIAIILLNSFLAMLISAMTMSNMYLIPPLLNINGVATVNNMLVELGGLIMIIFAIILIAGVIIFLLLRLIGGIIFAIGIFFYLSEEYKYRAFGKNLLTIFIVIYLAPLILILLFSFWFGFMSSSISGALGYNGLNTVQASAGSYTATPINKTAINLNGATVLCNNGTSIYKAIYNSSLNNSDAHGALLAGCQEYVYYWGDGYIIMAFVSLLILLILIFGAHTIGGAFVGLTGVGGEGAISITKGLKGKPLKEKLSKIHSNIQKNKSRYVKLLDKKGGIGKVFGGAALTRSKDLFGGAVKLADLTENLTYGVATAPIVGTSLGNVLDVTRKGVKNVIATATAKPEKYSYGKSDDVINEYANKIKKPDESDESARIRAKQELRDKYGFVFDEKTGSFKVSNKNLKAFKDRTKLDINTTSSAFNEIEGYNEAKEEYEDSKAKLKEVQERYKKGTARKSDVTKAEEKVEESKNKLNKLATDNGYKSFEAYEEMKKVNDSYMKYQEAIASGNDKKKKKAKEKFVKTIEAYESKYGVKMNGKKLVKMMETPEGRLDADNIIDTAFSLLDPEMGAAFISGAVDGNKSIVAKTHIGILANGIAKGIKTEFLKPAETKVKERYYSINDILGKMKNYKLMSGVGLIDQYNEEIKDLNEQLEAVGKEYDKNLEILSDKNAKIEDKKKAMEDIESLNRNLDVLRHKKEQLERTKKYAETPEMLILSVLNKKAIDELKYEEAKNGNTISTRDAIERLLDMKQIKSPLEVFDKLSKLASGDELGRVNITKAMLENELRIKRKSTAELEKELNKIIEAENDKDLTESQKIQFKKMEENLKYKINISKSEVARIRNDYDGINSIISNLKIIKKPVILSTNYTLEKEYGGYLDSNIILNSKYGELVNNKLDINETNDLLNKFKDKDNYYDIFSGEDAYEKFELFNRTLKDKAQRKIISDIYRISEGVKENKNVITFLKDLDKEKTKNILTNVIRTKVDVKNDVELSKKYNEFLNSISSEINKGIFNEKNVGKISEKLIKDSGLEGVVDSTELSNTLINKLSDKEIMNKLYADYKDNFNKIAEQFKDYASSEVKKIDEIKKPFFIEDKMKIIYGGGKDNVFSDNKSKRDMEIAEDMIKNLLEEKAERYNLRKETISVLSSLNNSIDEIKDKAQREVAIEFIDNEIIPEFRKMKYNIVTKKIINAVDTISDAEENKIYRKKFINSETLERISDMERIEEMTKMASDNKRVIDMITGNKNTIVGNTMPKNRFNPGIKVLRGPQSNIKSMNENEEGKTNESDIDEINENNTDGINRNDDRGNNDNANDNK